MNSQGTAFKAPTLSTGLGSYIAQVGNTVVSKSTVKPSIIIMFVLIMAFIKKINIHEQTVYSNPNYSCMSVIEKLLRSYTCSCYI